MNAFLMTKQTLTPARFDIVDDDLGVVERKHGRAAEGYTLGQTWNGWARPYFTHGEAVKVAEANGGRYDSAKDAFVFDGEGWKEHLVFGEEPESYGAVTAEIDGKPAKLYPIGNGCWTWDRFAPAIPDMPQQVTSEAEAKALVDWFERHFPLSWHPDDSYAEYEEADHVTTFLYSEAKHLKELMVKAYEFLDPAEYAMSTRGETFAE